MLFVEPANFNEKFSSLPLCTLKYQRQCVQWVWAKDEIYRSNTCWTGTIRDTSCGVPFSFWRKSVKSGSRLQNCVQNYGAYFRIWPQMLVYGLWNGAIFVAINYIWNIPLGVANTISVNIHNHNELTGK